MYGDNSGCKELLKKIYEIKPKYHIFGHIHEDFGIKKLMLDSNNECVFINSSYLTATYDQRKGKGHGKDCFIFDM